MNDKLAEMCEEFEKLAKFDAIKKKKLDPKAKIRSRGKCCLPAEHPLVTDRKDHYPINDIDQARNALARASGHSSVPDWFKGSLKQLVSIVARKVHAQYPKIKMTSKSRKPGKC